MLVQEIKASIKQIEEANKLSSLSKIAGEDREPDFIDIDLSNEDLSDADLSGMNLRAADLRGINLSNADLGFDRDTCKFVPHLPVTLTV